MKNTPLVFVAVLLIAAGCVSRTYVNRPPYRHGYPNYGYHHHNGWGYNRPYNRTW